MNFLMVTVKEKFHFKIRRDRFQRNAVRTVKYFIRLSCEHSRRGQTKQEPVDKTRLPATVVGNEPTLTPPPPPGRPVRGLTRFARAAAYGSMLEGYIIVVCYQFCLLTFTGLRGLKRTDGRYDMFRY